MRTTTWIPVALALACAGAGCNSLLGIDDPTVVPGEGGTAGSTGGQGGAGGTGATGGAGGVAGDASVEADVVGDAGGAAGDASVEADAAGAGGAAGDASVEADVVGDVGWDAGDGGGIGAIGQPCAPSNALACAGHAQKLVLICDAASQKWAVLQSCSGKQLCDTAPGPSQGSCQDPVPVCIGHNPGEKVCDGTKLVQCGPDLLTSTETACPYACVAGSCAGTCKPGAKQCNVLVPQTCDSNGAWQDGASCPYVCASGACTGSCSPGTKQCNGNMPQTCDSNGVWTNGTACPNVCSNGACAGSCSPGSKQCSGNTVQTCDAGGKWQDGTVCPYVCASGACTGVCSPGGKQCSGKTPQTCDASGQWQGGAACQYVCAGGACTGVCTPDAKDCLGLVPRTCDATGQWQAGAPCTYVCSAGACTGVCSPNAKDCVGLVPRTCDATGQWQAGSACPFVCTAGTCTGSCSPGAKQCNGQVPQTCVGGTWQDGAACQNQACVNGACTGVCAPAAKGCNGQVPQTCDGTGQWQNGSACQNQACVNGACVGVCTPGAKRCSGSAVQTCQASGQWDAGTACGGGTPVCLGGQCISAVAQSCVGGGPGKNTCGPVGTDDCCASPVVTGGTFKRSYDGATYNDPNYPATVSDFRLDAYEITVGRFRAFVNAGKGTQASPPADGDGGHPKIANSGWQSAWNPNLAALTAGLKNAVKCSQNYQTWTDSAAGNESRPMVCISWFEAFAFCAWDAGRMPTEAEWNYAAAGGAEQRKYPWGSTVPGADANLAVYNCYYGGGTCVGVQNIAPVGSVAAGKGKWGQFDLAGNAYEWNLDWWASPYDISSCNDCASLTQISVLGRVFRGSSFDDILSHLLSSFRNYDAPFDHGAGLGVRCARIP